MADIAGAWNNGGKTSVAVFLSDGSKFPGWTQWSDRDGGWGDTVKWVAGDFNGDGLTDVGAAWNNDGLTTLDHPEVDGARFTPVHWLAQRGSLVRRLGVPGRRLQRRRDSPTSPRCGTTSRTTRSRSTCPTARRSSPRATGRRATAAWGTEVKWVPGDFNGDGMTDIAAVWDYFGVNVLTVRASTGAGFSAAHWSEDGGGWVPTTAWCAGTFDPN